MRTVKGNFIILYALHLVFGILFLALNLFWDTDFQVNGHYLYILGISAFPALIFIFILNRNHNSDEREVLLERKIASYSLMTVFLFLMGMYGSLNKFSPTADWIVALISVALISKGGFGLYFFIRE